MMNLIQEKAPNLKRRIVAAWPLLFFLLLYWVVRFWSYTEFGFYEDDHHYVLRAINMPYREFVKYTFDVNHFLRFFGAGHPLHPRLITAGTKLGWWVGELRGLYWIAFFIGAVNISLFYKLMKRVHSASLGFSATLMYVLYSADTTQAYLTFALGLQPSITFFLIAAHLYISGNRWIPYGLSVLSLLTYETVFPIYFALPLLRDFHSKDRFKELWRHALATASIFAAIVIWRALVGENRLAQLTLAEAITTPIFHSIQGPIVSLGTYLYRPIQVLLSMTPGILIACGILAVSITILLLKAYPEVIQEERPGVEPLQRTRGLKAIGGLFRRDRWEQLDQRVKSLLWLAGTGVLMLILAYPLTFTVRAYAISGRDTRVHAAGVLGAAILLGSLSMLILSRIRNRPLRRGVVLGIGIWLSLLGGFGFIVQRDYVQAWKYQQEFWSSLVPFAPDLEDGTTILVDPQGLIEPRFIAANTWSLPNVLKHLYVFPDEWDSPPRVHRLLPDWRSRTLENSTEIKALDYMWEYVVVPWDDLIVLETEDGEIVNRFETIQLDGVKYSLKPYESDQSLNLPASRVYPYFIVE